MAKRVAKKENAETEAVGMKMDCCRKRRDGQAIYTRRVRE